MLIYLEISARERRYSGIYVIMATHIVQKDIFRIAGVGEWTIYKNQRAKKLSQKFYKVSTAKKPGHLRLRYQKNIPYYQTKETKEKNCSMKKYSISTKYEVK